MCSRQQLKNRAEILRAVKQRRGRTLPDERSVSGGRAAWALCVTPWRVRDLIEDGSLPAEQVFDWSGRYHWEIAVEEIKRLTAEIDA
jgi:hypothetical protein